MTLRFTNTASLTRSRSCREWPISDTGPNDAADVLVARTIKIGEVSNATRMRARVGKIPPQKGVKGRVEAVAPKRVCSVPRTRRDARPFILVIICKADGR
jgi:hypothetical protein